MGGSVARVARTWLAVVGMAIGVSVVLPATPAAAHNSLTGSDPRNGARLAAAPKRIELRFLATPAPRYDEDHSHRAGQRAGGGRRADLFRQPGERAVRARGGRPLHRRLPGRRPPTATR